MFFDLWLLVAMRVRKCGIDLCAVHESLGGLDDVGDPRVGALRRLAGDFAGFRVIRTPAESASNSVVRASSIFRDLVPTEVPFLAIELSRSDQYLRECLMTTISVLPQTYIDLRLPPVTLA